MNRNIEYSQKAHASKSMGPHVRQVIPSAVHHVDPFVFLDHFGPIQKDPDWQGVPPHPHAGIATITYLFTGSNRHVDSYGHNAIIQAGDIAWMQAGKGIVHAEGIHEERTEPEMVHGLQFWISLPARHKFIEPDFFHYPSAQLPQFTLQHSTVKVLCGELLGHASPVQSLSPAYIYDVNMPMHQTIEIPIKPGDTAGLYLVSGSIRIHNQVVLPATISTFDAEGDTLQIHSNDPCRFILFGGTPLHEPIVGYASYVMNTEAQIHQVIMDYQQGKMGTIKI